MRCGKCFSLIYSTYPDGSVGVPYGTLIDEPSLKPMHHQFVGSKAPWYEIRDDLPQHDEYPWSRSTGNPRGRLQASFRNMAQPTGGSQVGPSEHADRVP